MFASSETSEVLERRGCEPMLGLGAVTRLGFWEYQYVRLLGIKPGMGLKQKKKNLSTPRVSDIGVGPISHMTDRWAMGFLLSKI